MQLLRSRKNACICQFRGNVMRNIWYFLLGSAFSWNDGKPDFEFTANGRRYEVCFVTPKNRSVKIQFEQRNLIKMIVSTAFSGKMAEAFNLQPKVKELSPPEIANGGTYFGRMVYTGRGFLKALEGGVIVPQKKNFNEIDF